MKLEATAGSWIDAIRAVVPHAASAKDMLPILNAVRIETDGTDTFLVATDRYTLIMYRLETTDVAGEGSVTLNLADVQRLAKLAADWTRISVPLSLTVEGDRATFTTPESTATCHALDGTFPAYRTLIASAIAALDDSEVARTSDFGANPALLAKWAKSCGKHDRFSVRLTRADKVAVVSADSFVGLHMPTRYDGGHTLPSWAPSVFTTPTVAVA